MEGFDLICALKDPPWLSFENRWQIVRERPGDHGSLPGGQSGWLWPGVNLEGWEMAKYWMCHISLKPTCLCLWATSLIWRYCYKRWHNLYLGIEELRYFKVELKGLLAEQKWGWEIGRLTDAYRVWDLSNRGWSCPQLGWGSAERNRSERVGEA